MSNLLIANGAEARTLKGLITESEAWDATFSEIRTNAQELKFEPDGIRWNGELHQLDEEKRKHLFEKAGAPGGYWGRHSADLQAAGLTAHAAMGDFGTTPTLVLRGGELVTIARGELFTLPNADVIRAVQEALGNDGDDLSVARIGSEVDRLEVELVSPSKSIAVRRGDIIQSGIHIIHPRFGSEATLIQAFIYRLVCTNGMTRRECQGTRTRKLPVDFPNNRSLQMEQVRRLTQQNWSGLHSQLEALRATSERPAHVQELLTRWLQRARISPGNMMPRLLEAWREEGAEETHYGAVNALTRVATHDSSLSVRQRRVLASLAGLLAFSEVHLCERCWSVLAGAAARESFAA